MDISKCLDTQSKGWVSFVACHMTDICTYLKTRLKSIIILTKKKIKVSFNYVLSVHFLHIVPEAPHLIPSSPPLGLLFCLLTCSVGEPRASQTLSTRAIAEWTRLPCLPVYDYTQGFPRSPQASPPPAPVHLSLLDHFSFFFHFSHSPRYVIITLELIHKEKIKKLAHPGFTWIVIFAICSCPQGKRFVETGLCLLHHPVWGKCKAGVVFKNQAYWAQRDSLRRD